jgi:hypothetical protein
LVLHAAECVRALAEQEAAPEAELEVEAIGCGLLHGVGDPLVQRGVVAAAAIRLHGDAEAPQGGRAPAPPPPPMIAALTIVEKGGGALGSGGGLPG